VKFLATVLGVLAFEVVGSLILIVHAFYSDPTDHLSGTSAAVVLGAAAVLGGGLGWGIGIDRQLAGRRQD
jgi:hypothetical protein